MVFLSCPICPHGFLINVEDLHNRVSSVLTRELKCPLCFQLTKGLSALGSHLSLHVQEGTIFTSDCSLSTLINNKLPLSNISENYKMSPSTSSACLTRSDIAHSEPIPELEKLDIRDSHTSSDRCLSEKNVNEISCKRLNETSDFLKQSSLERCSCDLCGLIFTSEHFLRLHKNVFHKHSDSADISCKMCDQIFQDLETYRNHVQNFHKEKRYLCDDCPKTFKLKGSLVVHRRMYHDVSPEICHICQRKFSSRARRLFHERKCHTEEYYSKDSRNLVMENIYPALEKQVQSCQPSDDNNFTHRPKAVKDKNERNFDFHDQSQEVDCPITPENYFESIGMQAQQKFCEGSMASNSTSSLNMPFKIHANTSIDPVTFQKYLHSAQQEQVISIENAQLPESQTKLVNKFDNEKLIPPSQPISQEGKLSEHSAFLQSNQNFQLMKNISCAEQSSTPTNSSIKFSPPQRDSIRKQSPEQSAADCTKGWLCDVCKKSFTTKYFLKKHKRLHTGETPYSCGECGKAFAFQQSYHKHLLYHTDEKPHTCSYCGRAFKEMSTLHNHVRIHTGEKPFVCDTCGKAFRQRVSFLVHSRIHTGVLPYSCGECGKSFRYKVALRSHKCDKGQNSAQQESERNSSNTAAYVENKSIQHETLDTALSNFNSYVNRNPRAGIEVSAKQLRNSDSSIQESNKSRFKIDETVLWPTDGSYSPSCPLLSSFDSPKKSFNMRCNATERNKNITQELNSLQLPLNSTNAHLSNVPFVTESNSQFKIIANSTTMNSVMLTAQSGHGYLPDKCSPNSNITTKSSFSVDSIEHLLNFPNNSEIDSGEMRINLNSSDKHVNQCITQTLPLTDVELLNNNSLNSLQHQNISTITMQTNQNHASPMLVPSNQRSLVMGHSPVQPTLPILTDDEIGLNAELLLKDFFD